MSETVYFIHSQNKHSLHHLIIIIIIIITQSNTHNKTVGNMFIYCYIEEIILGKLSYNGLQVKSLHIQPHFCNDFKFIRILFCLEFIQSEFCFVLNISNQNSVLSDFIESEFCFVLILSIHDSVIS